MSATLRRPTAAQIAKLVAKYDLATNDGIALSEAGAAGTWFNWTAGRRPMPASAWVCICHRLGENYKEWLDGPSEELARVLPPDAAEAIIARALKRRDRGE